MSFQLVVDCTDPDRVARFWLAALHYVPQPPPDGFASWEDAYRAMGVPEDELGVGLDSIVDPAGAGPRIWFQQVPEAKTVKNRLHLDVLVGGGRSVPVEERRLRVDAEVERLVGLGATRLPVADDPYEGHYGVALLDPEGNEFDVA